MFEIILFPGEPALFREGSIKNYKGARLAGGSLHQCRGTNFQLEVQEVRNDLWHISYREYFFSKETIFISKEESNWLRLELVLTGSLPIQVSNGKSHLLRSGQYQVTNSNSFKSHFKASSDCKYLVISLSSEMISSIGVPGITDRLTLRKPKSLPDGMNDIAVQMLNNPYSSDLQEFFFDNCIRDLVLRHLAAGGIDLPDGINEKEYSGVMEADNIIASDLSAHHSIRSLARQTGLNEYSLKKGFKIVFGVGTFERLLQRRMDKAKELMEATNKPLKEIASLAGYSTYHGFSTGFRRRFGMPPSDWLEKRVG